MTNTINFNDGLSVHPRLWIMSSPSNGVTKSTRLLSPVISSSSSIAQNGQLSIISQFIDNSNNYSYVFSNAGNFYRQVWDSENQVWTDSEGNAGEFDYYLLNTTTTANKVLASPNGSTGKPDFRSLVTNDLPLVTYAKGGTGVAASSAYEASRALYGARTKGDTITMNNHVANGYLTNAKKSAYVILSFPYMFYGSPTVSLSGTFTARQNDNYLFGSTATTPRNLSNVTVSTAIAAAGWIRVAITGSEQSAAINNNPICFYFNTLTVTLS